MKIPYGYCHCGCGEKTNIAPYTHEKYGWVKGEPLRFIFGHQNRREVVPRFWQKVDRRGPKECWPWLGNTTDNGYGRFWYDHHTHPAHRVAYQIANDIPIGKNPYGIVTCHRCDNPPCCNPTHLFLGTNMDNTQDAVEKGRMSHGERHSKAILPNRPRGERHHNCRFTDEQVAEMRELYESRKMSQHQIAARFHTSQPAIQRIVTYKSRK